MLFYCCCLGFDKDAACGYTEYYCISKRNWEPGMNMKQMRRLAAAVLLALLCALPFVCRAQVYFDTVCDLPAEQGLEWTIFDVDEGDAMLLTCEGESMLVDGGANPYRVLLMDALRARGITHMKYVLNTHYHDDHIDGIRCLFENGFTADAYLHPYTERQIEKNERASKTAKAAQKAGVPMQRIVEGDTIRLGSAQISVYRCMEYENANGRSLVLKVDYKDTSILLCADIIGKVQHYFADHYPPETFDADLIKMAHHARTPMVSGFLDLVSPEAAIVTNRIEYAERMAKNQFEKRELDVRFSGEGTIRAFTDGTDWYINQSLGEF